MAEPIVLFVKSEKIDQVQWTMPHHDHYCSAGYRASKTDLVLREEDKKTVEVLEERGLQYTLIDISLASTTARIKAKIEGINKTPTLICKGQKFKGLQQIMELLETMTNIQK